MRRDSKGGPGGRTGHCDSPTHCTNNNSSSEADSSSINQPLPPTELQGLNTFPEALALDPTPNQMNQVQAPF
jgi:hypothetical protein